MTRSLAVVVLALALALLAPAVLAQVSTGLVEVTAIEDQKPLPGVTVELVNQENGYARTALTGADGTASFAALPPATYAVRLTMASYAPIERAGLALRVGQTLRMKINLTGAIAEAVDVVAKAPLVDQHKMDASTNIVPEQIRELPVPNRDFQKLAFIAPGVQRERGDFRFINGGPVVGSGGNASQATIMVDGQDFTDQALGLARTRFSQDAIREFRVIQNRFDVEIGGSAGGALSIATRRGTNETSGSVFGFYRADALRARGALEQSAPDFSRWQGGITLGGPIVKDRTHYFVSLEQIDEKNIALFRPAGAFASTAADVRHPFDQTLALVSVDHLINANQTLEAKLVYERYREDNFRVGGVSDVSNGYSLDRDNWNLSVSHTWLLPGNRINELRFLAGQRKYDEPTNSNDVGNWYSSGNTLRTGTNATGDVLGDGKVFELRDTFRWQAGKHGLKGGLSVQRILEESKIEVFENGLFLWSADPGNPYNLPIAYTYGVGSSDVNVNTTLFGAFLQDDWRVRPNLSIALGLRYDYDTNGNDPNFRHPLVPNGRSRDSKNIQPRVGFTWDVKDDGRFTLRGGTGLFAGRYLLVPAFTELQQNGITGRRIQSRINGIFLGLPPAYWLDPANPTTTGIALPTDIVLIDNKLDTPTATQSSLGGTWRLGRSGLFLDVEAIYATGTDEIVVRDRNWAGNDAPAGTLMRPIAGYNQVNTYTNEGRSRYKALVTSLNGTLPGGHLLTVSLTLADKKNIADDFSPEFPFGYPNDPAHIDREWGRSRADERWHVVASGVFRLPWNVTVAPIFEYGSGQPWTQRLGYDWNGDGKNSDRAPGVARNAQSGPAYRALNLRLTKLFPFRGRSGFEFVAECFNVFNTINYDVSSVDGALYLNGPTRTLPAQAYVVNPNYGVYRATLPPREVQLGVRYTF